MTVRTATATAMPVGSSAIAPTEPIPFKATTIDRSPSDFRMLETRYVVGQAVARAKALAQARAQVEPKSRPIVVVRTIQPHSSNEAGFLACLRGHESDTAGGYQAVNPGGYYGAYQFSQSTWDNTARHIHRLDLVGKRPDQVDPATQNMMATALHDWQGSSPWAGDDC